MKGGSLWGGRFSQPRFSFCKCGHNEIDLKTCTKWLVLQESSFDSMTLHNLRIWGVRSSNLVGRAIIILSNQYVMCLMILVNSSNYCRVSIM
jgi:hypothetical protein